MTDKEREIIDDVIFDVSMEDYLETSTIDKPYEIPVEITEFVRMEYKLIDVIATKKKYFEWKRKKQSLQVHNGKTLDIIEIVYKQTSDQEEYENRAFYFDITKCYNRRADYLKDYKKTNK